MTNSRPYTVIEAGFSRYPSMGSYGRRPLVDGDVYIALSDFGSLDPVDATAQKVAWGTSFNLGTINGLEEGRRHVVRAAMASMPFENGTADEIIAPNFGNPAISDVERSVRALEYARVLRPTGLLTVVETLDSGVMAPDSMATFLQGYGFRSTGMDEYDPHAIENYTGCEINIGYVATFTLAPSDNLAA